MSDTDYFVSATVIEKMTGYQIVSKQLEELHRQGFWRARINRAGVVVLEQAHYQAVCAGTAVAPVRTPRLRDSGNRRAGVRREERPSPP